ncbi:unnamed protein product [Staurois parvus]|uniref:Secreted protein n=1 Tax=Staurois parvus TaxID=386267 RepID=A0ABN9F9E5_9NEOB|nr:unnamed protein product [Staurois parvus]
MHSIITVLVSLEMLVSLTSHPVSVSVILPATLSQFHYKSLINAMKKKKKITVYRCRCYNFHTN